MTGPMSPEDAEQLQYQRMQQLLSQSTPYKCTGCGNHTFEQIHFMRRLSPIVSPTGKAAMIPLPTYACNACGRVPDEFIPEFMRYEKSDATESSPNVSTDLATKEGENTRPPISKGGLVLEP
jgi:hypothetical protein